jgi:hypothetical protein
MPNKPLITELVDFYYQIEDTINVIAMMGNINIEELTLLLNLKIQLDTILTNVSKSWAADKFADTRPKRYN